MIVLVINIYIKGNENIYRIIMAIDLSNYQNVLTAGVQPPSTSTPEEFSNTLTTSSLPE